MLESAIVAASVLGVLLVLQAALVVAFVAVLGREPRAREDALPKAAILLPLRGADPQLAETLRRLVRQDYPDFKIRIVIDSPEDSSWAVVDQVLSETGARHVFATSIRRRRKTCGLQCSALVEAVQSLGEDVEVVAIADGDLVAHPTWLRELATALLDERVGVAYGNRWFMPADAQWGSLVRYVWNAAAVVPMWLFGIPWGGSFAIRRRVLLESGLFEKWPTAIVHDAPSPGFLKPLGLRVRFVPSLMMVIRERCSLPFALDFFKRQMLWTRMYHTRFWPVALHALIAAGAPAAAFAIAVWSAIAGRFDAAAWAEGALLLYWAGMGAQLALLELAVRRVVRGRDEPTAWLTPLKLLILPPAMLLTLLVHFAAVLLATFRRRVLWRGVTYQIDSPFTVRILNDRPMPEPAEPDVSL